MAKKRFGCSFPPNSIPQPHPWLLICHGKHRQTQTFFSISQGRRIVRTIPELRNKTIWTYYDEWLVLADNESSQLSLLSLISMETIQLPEIKEFDPENTCILSSCPSSPDCSVFIFSSQEPNRTLLYCKLGDSEFKVQEFQIDDTYWKSAAAFGGKIYVLTGTYSFLYMVEFNNNTEQPRLIPLTSNEPLKPPAGIVCSTSRLVESNGEILSVTVMYYGTGMHSREVFGFLIQQFDYVEKEWIEMKSLGKTRALFINNYWGISCLANEESGVQGNSIYFVEDYDRCLYVFNLEKKTISFSMPCPDVDRRRSIFQWINLPPTHPQQNLV